MNVLMVQACRPFHNPPGKEVGTKIRNRIEKRNVFSVISIDWQKTSSSGCLNPNYGMQALCLRLKKTIVLFRKKKGILT